YSCRQLEERCWRYYPVGVTNRSSTNRAGAAAKRVRNGSRLAKRDQDVALGAPAKRELVALLQRRTASEGQNETAIPALKFYRYSQPTEPANVLMEPAVYVVVQGRKRVTVGGRSYVYDPSRYLAVSVDLPAVGYVLEASPEKPYLCMTLAV